MNTSDDHRTPVYRSKAARIGLFLSLALLIFVVGIDWLKNRAFEIEIFGVEVLSIESRDLAPTYHVLPPPPPPLPVVPDRPVPPANEVFVVAEQMPRLVGGLASIQQAIKYPAIAKSAGVEGRVIVQFVVDEQGNVADPVVVRGIGSGCDEEAVRALREARFEPGRQHGEPVKVKMSIPITFRLR